MTIAEQKFHALDTKRRDFRRQENRAWCEEELDLPGTRTLSIDFANAEIGCHLSAKVDQHG